jgi:hypothetical protein
MRRFVRLTRARAVVLAVVAGVCVGATAYLAGAASSKDAIQRTVHGPVAPVNAPGQALYLQQLVIQPGAKLPEHFHEGTQLATITNGVLTYNVVSGTVNITRANGKTAAVTGPAVVSLEKGDTIVETPSLVHYGSNKGKQPVSIELASLLRAGAPLSTPVGQGEAGATPMQLQATLSSQSHTLHVVGASAQYTYGWNQLVGTATVNGAPVGIELLGAVSYENGSGPFAGFTTFSFADGSTIGVSMQGMATVGSGGTTTFDATLGIIGGTGQYSTVTGDGTFTGSRTAALGTDVDATFTLQLHH